MYLTPSVKRVRAFPLLQLKGMGASEMQYCRPVEKLCKT